MDKIGLRELMSAAVRAGRASWEAEGSSQVDSGPGLDSDTVLDRLTQTALVALEHENEWLWEAAISALLEVYCLGLPEEQDAWRPDTSYGRWMARIAQRVLLLGAVAHRHRRYTYLPALVMQNPVPRFEGNFWLRYAVTMASRGKVADVFQGKSLIGPASEVVRERAQFFALFDENLDFVVNDMCQFDFLACIITVGETKDVDRCYPNFGGYFSHRTLPVVHDLIHEGPSREAVPNLAAEDLAEIFGALGSLASENFVGIAGWEGYDADVRDFLRLHE